MVHSYAGWYVSTLDIIYRTYILIPCEKKFVTEIWGNVRTITFYTSGALVPCIQQKHLSFYTTVSSDMFFARGVIHSVRRVDAYCFRFI